MIDPTIGDRIVVRYRLDEDGAPADWRAEPNPTLPSGPSQSDVTGVLLMSDERYLNLDRGGAVVAVPRVAITSIRLLSRRVVRNSEIRDVERALCTRCDATHRTEIDGWIVSAGGSTLRGRVAVPVEFNAPPAAVPEIIAWYVGLGLPALALLPDRLLRPDQVTIADAHAMEVLVTESAGGQLDGLTPTAVDDTLWAVDVDADDDGVRLAARRAGYELHHTANVGELVEP